MHRASNWELMHLPGFFFPCWTLCKVFYFKYSECCCDMCINSKPLFHPAVIVFFEVILNLQFESFVPQVWYCCISSASMVVRNWRGYWISTACRNIQCAVQASSRACLQKFLSQSLQLGAHTWLGQKASTLPTMDLWWAICQQPTLSYRARKMDKLPRW